MKVLKGFVKNRSNPEGCMVEKYNAEECTSFCAPYIKEAAQVGVQQSRYEEYEERNILEGRPIGKAKLKELSPNMFEVAHLYVLENTAEVEPYRE